MIRLCCLMLAFCACTVMPTAAPTHYPATPQVTPVPLLLTPIATPRSLPSLPPLMNSQSSKVLTLHDNMLITVNPDSNSITLIDVPSLRVLREIHIGGSPRTVTIQSQEAIVTLWDEDALAIVDVDQGQVRRIESVCHMPFGVVADEERVYVSCFADDQIAVIDLQTASLLYYVSVADAPAGLALSGNWLLVTHLYIGSITVLNVERTPFVLGSVHVETDGELARTIVVSPDGLRAYVPQTRTGLALISTQYMQDWLPIVSVLDIGAMRANRALRVTLSVLDQDANMPSDIAFSESGDVLYVTLAGSDTVFVLDAVSLQLRARIPVGANPTGVLSDGEQILVVNALDGTVSVIDANSYTVTAVISVTDIPLSDELLRGKILFHRASAPQMSDGAISCATCHFEGGADGRTWINFRSGPRNTPILGGASALPPYNWAGDMGELHDTIEDQIRNVMLGDGLIDGDFDSTTQTVDAERSNDLDALIAYVASLRPWKSPYRMADGSLSDSARRGMDLFMSGTIGCGCHAPPLYTDLHAHNLTGAVFSLEIAPAFDTPSLRGLWASAPYMHDGIVQSLPELFTRTDPIHSIAADLTSQQLDDLIAFLMSL